MEPDATTILERLDDAVYTVDAHWHLTYMNRAAETISGRSRHELVGHNIWDMFPQAVDLPAYTELHTAMTRQRAVMLEYRSPVVGRWLDLRAYPLGDGLAIHFRDITDRKRAEAALRESEARLTVELADAKQLQRISSSLIQEDTIEHLYEQILDAARAVMRSDMASIQRLFAERNELFLLAHRGFAPESAAFWEWVTLDSGSSCGAAWAAGARVVVPDVDACAWMASTNDLQAYRQSGVRAVQSTPLVARDGTLVGMLSTHWRQPHHPTERALRLFDVLARQAADLIERARAEDALRASEERLRLALSASAMGTWQYRVATDEGSLDPSMCRLLGLPPGTELISLAAFLVLVHADDRDRVRDQMARCLRDGSELDLEYRVVWPDGTVLWLKHRGHLLRTADDRPLFLAGAAMDITVRRAAEDRLAYQALVLEHIQDAVVATDTALRITAWNRAAETLYGSSAQEVLGRDLREVVRSEYGDARRTEALRVVADTGDLRTESVHRRCDGTAMLIEGSSMPLRAADRSSTGYVYVFRDITERRQVEAERQRQQELLQSIFDHIPVMIRFVDADGHLQFVNRAYTQTLGWSLEELQQPDHDVFATFYPDPRERQRMLAHLAAATSAWADFATHVRDGTVLATSWAHIRLTDGTAIGIGQDITERKQAEEALQRAYDDLETIIAERTGALEEANESLRLEIAERTLSERARLLLLEQVVNAEEEERRRISRELHDSLGQYLTALHLGLKSAQEQDHLPPGMSSNLQKLRELALRIDRTVDRLSFELRPPALDDLGLEAALRLLVKEWSATSRIPVDVHIGGLNHRRLPASLETTVYRVVQEALTNILKHAQATRLSLIVERREAEVLAIIEDDGRGFDLATATHAQSGRQQLGLTGMRERVALVAGRLEIEAVPGAGTTIYLHIPLAREEPTGEGASNA